MLRSRRTRGWLFGVSRRSNQRRRFVKPNCSAVASSSGAGTGLSAFYARSDDEVLDLGEDRLDAFATLFVYRLTDVIDAGFEVVPTYRSPHVTITFYDDVHSGVARLLAVAHRTVSNPAYRQEEA